MLGRCCGVVFHPLKPSTITSVNGVSTGCGSATILDSQTRRLSVMIAKAIGYDAAKHIKGRKLCLLVDTLGLVLVAVMTAANASERDGTRLVFAGIPDEPSPADERLCLTASALAS